MFCGKPASSVFRVYFTHISLMGKHALCLCLEGLYKVSRCLEILIDLLQCLFSLFVFGAQKASCQILLDVFVEQQITYLHLPCRSLLLHWYGSVLRFLFIQAEEKMNPYLKRHVRNVVLLWQLVVIWQLFKRERKKLKLTYIFIYIQQTFAR